MIPDGMLWRRVFAPFAVGYFLSYLLRNANAVISPELTVDLGLHAADLGLLTAAYLFAFGAFQLPLGLLLDRFGPRRVEAVLLLICAGGCALFASGHALPQLTLGRALIGLGVSACLMASFKAFSLWFPLERQAALNAAIMAAGGLGALAASSPLGELLPFLGWRGIFVALAGLALLAAGLIFSTPEKTSPHAPETLSQQLKGLAAIFRHRRFWQFAPLAAGFIGGFMALQGLWAIPWLIHVNGLERDHAAFHMLILAGAQLTAFLSIAFFVQRLAHLGITQTHLLRHGMGVGMLALLTILLDWAPTWLAWPLLGGIFAIANLAYALHATTYPVALAGRANTALNLAVFVGAFGMQWLFGVVVDAGQTAGLDTATAFRFSLGGLLLLQVAGWSWFELGLRRAPDGHLARPVASEKP